MEVFLIYVLDFIGVYLSRIGQVSLLLSFFTRNRVFRDILLGFEGSAVVFSLRVGDVAFFNCGCFRWIAVLNCRYCCYEFSLLLLQLNCSFKMLASTLFIVVIEVGMPL